MPSAKCQTWIDMAYGLLIILSTQRRKATKMLCLRSFLASVFFVLQLSTLLLLVPSCSADSISSSSTTYRYIDHHKRHFHQDHQSETSIISSKELYRKDMSTEMPRIGHDGIQEQQYISTVNEETSAKQVVAASVNTQNFSNQESSSTKTTSKSPMLRVHRRLDVEDIFNEMARKDPSQWSAVDWVVLVLFLTMLCWVYSCLCALCCCGRSRGSGSTLLNWLCFYEICCRDGRELDMCCDYANAAIV